jgi:hypothetical protein
VNNLELKKNFIGRLVVSRIHLTGGSKVLLLSLGAVALRLVVMRREEAPFEGSCMQEAGDISGDKHRAISAFGGPNLN